jgi:hypothetical protein
MYLRFEDWTLPLFLNALDKKGLPHANRIIKIYSSEQDPRQVLGRSALTVIEKPGEKFSDKDEFAYTDRESYSGSDLEDKLSEYRFGEVGKKVTRSLFRFSNALGFCQAAMAARRPDGEWIVKHPFRDIDGLELACRSLRREYAIHLDIFFPDSIVSLGQIVDIDNPDNLINLRESAKLLRTLSSTD